jgi:predicted ester cyclase
MLRAFMVTPVLAATLVGAMTMNRLPVVAAQDATPAAECASTTPEENKAAVDGYLQALFGGGDPSGFLSSDFVYHDPSGDVDDAPGNEDTTTWASSRREDFPDEKFTDDMIVAEGDTVAAYLNWTGTQQDDDEETGVPNTGKRAEWVSSVFVRFECGKIADVWTISDDLGRLEDLGVISDEELQSAEAVATPAG